MNQQPLQNEPVENRDFFLTLALVYLVLPNLIFLCMWLRPWIGIPAALLVAFCLFRLAKFSGTKKSGPVNLGLVLVAAMVWTLMCGVGGFLPQSVDYVKHNLIFHDLVASAWPVNYSIGGIEKNYLCYGLGYYLVPALGERMIGAGILPVSIFIWTFAGVALFFWWLAGFGKSPKKTLLIFLLFSLTAALWKLFKEHGIPGLVVADGLDKKLQQLGLLFSYNDNFGRFLFTPQHALAGWLGTAVLYEMLWVKKNPGGALFAWAACLIWSPLTCLGLLVVPLAAMNRVRWQAYFSPANLLGGGLLLAIMGIYFQGHAAVAENGVIWNLSADSQWLLLYPLFLALGLSPLFILYLVDRKYSGLDELRPLFLVGCGFLILLPLYKIGFCSDLRLEASTPALLFAALGTAQCLQNDSFSLKRPLFIFLTASLLIGAIHPVISFGTNLLFNPYNYSYVNLEASELKNLTDLHDPGFDVTAQYVGRPNSAAARWLLR